MLKSLYISNYALIDKIEVDFKEGLTIITGETGAGKSIILGALSLILGERADMNTIRDKSKKTIVEGIFGIGKLNLDAEMESLGIEFDGDELIVRREIAPNGRSRAFVNDTPVQVSELKNVMTQLIDIHSQHSNMLLSTEEFQIAALDSIGKSQQLLSQYQLHYFEYKELCSKLEKLVCDGEEAKKTEDYLRFQFNQLQELNLQPDEDERLEEELARLSNVTDIKAALWEVNN
ncbi:MAG: AAA family ATPase, partial [Muribaculaceae bacterium]|nr:AAA family ATPase [Muribaculaceae bacterium]